MTRQQTRSWGLTLAACLPLAVLLAGCTPAPEPAPAPTIAWSPAEPSGTYEDTDWVQTIRIYTREWALAFNSHDFTSPALAEVVSSSQISRLAREQRGFAEDSEYKYFPGPLPSTVVSLTEDGDTARVIVCEPTPAWLISKDHPEPSLDGATEAIYNLTRTDDGAVRIESIGATEQTCDLSDASIGTFDPQPDLSVSYSADDVKAP